MVPMSEVAKEVHLRIDQEEDLGVPSLTRSGVLEIVKSVFDIIALAVASGESVMIPKFGKFESKVSPARQARNPKTGKTIDVPEKLIVKFRPSSALRAKLLEAEIPEKSEKKKPQKKQTPKKKGKK